MKNPRIIFRRAYNRLSPLLLLFQRSPFVQMLLPEAKIIGFAGGGEAAKWTIATIAGLGAYDSVSGASQITQLAPSPNSTTVNTAVGATLNFVYQVTGTDGIAGSWSIEFPLPPGLNHGDSIENSTDFISGIPSEEGEFPIRVVAWEDQFQTGDSLSQDFTIMVGPAVITQHPQSATISSGSTTQLKVTTAGSGLSYQWFTHAPPTTPIPISNATLATYDASPSATTTYLVRVVRGTIVSFSNPATVTVSANNTFANWRTAQFNSTQLNNPNISGPTADPDGDGSDNTKEYVFGTAPLTKEVSPLSFSVNGTNVSLSFTARTATGAGYSGRTRHYALETSSSLGAGTWSSPSGFSDIIGSGQTVSHNPTKNAVPTFYRLRVWLTP